MEPIRLKVFLNKGNGQKLVTIPKNCDIQAGDLITIAKAD